MNRRQSIKTKVIDFKHIDPKFEEDTLALLRSLYHIYHKKLWVYRKMATRKQKKELALNLVSVSLTGSAIAKAIVAPIFVSITAT